MHDDCMCALSKSLFEYRGLDKVPPGGCSRGFLNHPSTRAKTIDGTKTAASPGSGTKESGQSKQPCFGRHWFREPDQHGT